MLLTKIVKETPIFETGFEKSRKFYVRNNIFKFVIVAEMISNQLVEIEIFATAYIIGGGFKFFEIKFNLHYLRYESLKLSTRTPVGSVSYLIRD